MRLLTALTCVLSASVSVSALAIGDIKDKLTHLVERATPQQDTDRLLYSTSMPDFLAAKRARNPSNLAWDDNGCSFSPDQPQGFNFLPSCQRHDFGYRNYPIQQRCSAADRKRVDDNFKRDLYNECAKYVEAQKCRNTADVYYNTARALGGGLYC